MKRSRFFCENCHKEVRPSAKVCPHCGRFFTAVRCPECSYVVDAHEFVGGGPNCGYTGGDQNRAGQFETFDLDPQHRPSAPKRGMPGWVWPAGIVILLICFGILVLLYLRI